MKIGIDCRLHYYNRTGIGRYIRNLVRAFPDRPNDDLELVVLQSRREREAIAGAGVARTSKVVTPAHHRWERWLLASELSLTRIDALHSPDHVAPKRMGWMSVVTVHDLSFLAHPEAYSSDSLLYYANVFRTVQNAAKVIAVSEFTRQEILDRISIGPERVTTIYEAVDPAYYPREESECQRVRTRLNVPESYFLVVGTIEARKNLERLVAAYASLPRRDRPRLVFAGGRGYHYDRVLEAVQEHRLEDNVTFLGYVNDEDLPALYSGAAGLLYPSRYEGFGLPILEAMACGCPVITSNFGSMAEVAGDSAILVDPNSTAAIADGIVTLLEDSGLRNELVAKGHKRVKDFSWRSAAEQTVALYREAAGSH